jgi:hypothetical protein
MESSPPTQTESLSQTQAIKILNEWGSRGFFRDKNLGNSIHIEAIESTPCFTFHAQTQYEHRSVETLSQPYYGEQLDDKGTPPDMYEITVEKPSLSFENSSTDVIIPHTDKVSTCTTCYGNCRVICSSCSGCGENNCSNCSGGRVSCGNCGGGGYYSRTTYQTIYNDDQTSRQESKTESFSCDYCRGSGWRICRTCNGSGRLTCSWCGGYGEANCETCQAQGRVKTYEMLHVLFEYQELSQTIGAMEIPNNKLSKVTGTQILNKRGDRITTLAELSDKKLANHALEFLSQFDTSNSIICYQHFEIDEIPVFKVSYKKQSNSKEKSLWMYGNEYEVYFEGMIDITPEVKKRVLVALTYIALVSFIAGSVGAYFFKRHTDFSPVAESSTTTINASSATEDSTATTNDTCEVLQIEKRRLALGIDQRRYTSEVKAHFRKQYPALASALDAENKDLTSDMADWCTIAHAWLKEQEKQQVSPEELQNKPTTNSGVIESSTPVCSMILQEKLNKKTGKMEKTNPCAD